MAGSRFRLVTFGVTKLALAVFMSGLLVAGLTLPFVGGVGIAARNSLQSFEDQPCDIDLTTPPQKSFIYASDGTMIATLFAYNRQIAAPKAIPDVMKKAVVAIEDRRFYDHHGVDVQGLVRAVVRNSKSGGVVQGGSTLTQQLVKQTRLYEAKTKEEQEAAIAQTPARKLLEARCALTLEKKYSKDDILWRYLNIANFGAGAYGIDTAAHTYFGSPVNKITLGQAALLAGLVQSPTKYNPRLHLKTASARRDTVLDEMQSLGYITAKQAVQAKATPIKLVPPQSQQQDCGNANRTIPNAGFFCDYLKGYLATIGYPQSRLETEGFKIYTTLDPKIQKSAQTAVMDHVQPDKRATAVMDVIDPTTGKVRAMAVSKYYGNNTKDKKQTVLRLPTLAKSGSGSTYKLFTLLAGLRQKIPLRDFGIKVGDHYQPSDNCDSGGGKVTPVKNAGHYGEGPWNLEDATYKSVNTFFVALLDQQMGCDLSVPVDYATKMGMTALNQRVRGHVLADTIKAGKQYSFTLGPFGTSPLQLAGAYGTIANQGSYCPPTPVEKIVDANNKPVALPERSCSQVVEPGIANTVSHVLEKDTLRNFKGTANGKFTGYYAQGGSPVAGKTGTASSDAPGDEGLNSAAWFVGFTPSYVGSVAVFNPDNPNTALRDIDGFSTGGDVFGSFGARIWVQALSPTLLNMPKWEFPAEDPEVVNGNSVPVPSVLGMDINTAKSKLEEAGFGIDVSGERKDAALPPDRIAEQSPSGRAMPGQAITVFLSSGHPPPGQTPGPGGLPIPGPGGPGPGGPGGGGRGGGGGGGGGGG